FVAYLFSKPKGQHADLRPLAMVINAIIVFGYLITWFRYAWKNILFWTAAAVFLVAHIGLYLVILQRYQRVPTTLYALLDVAELVIFSQCINRLVLKSGDDS
ncbi:MAG: hypothetical protein WA798_02710, partial [Candidatus Acidiferrum sp.]